MRPEHVGPLECTLIPGKNGWSATINGVRYRPIGEKQIEYRAAPFRYTEEHFDEVDALFAQGYRVMSACFKVAEKHGFPEESFYKRYTARRANKKMRGGGSLRA